MGFSNTPNFDKIKRTNVLCFSGGFVMDIICDYFPDHMSGIQSYEEDGILYINLAYSASSCEPQYMPPIP